MQTILPQNGEMTIDLEAVKSIVAVPNDSPFEALSQRYKLFNTATIVERAVDLGLVPTAAFYQKAHRLNRGGDEVRKHCIRLAHRDDLGLVKDRPEIVIINSHNGASALEIQMGIFRIVCSNGLVLKGEDYGGEKFYHRGKSMDTILNTLQFLIDRFDHAREDMKAYEGVTLSKTAKHDFALGARAIYNSHQTVPRAIDADLFLVPRRYEDSGDDLWHTFNVVQENMMKGGIVLHGRDDTHKRSAKTRPIREVTQSKMLNMELWDMAAKFFANDGNTPFDYLQGIMAKEGKRLFAQEEALAAPAPAVPTNAVDITADVRIIG